MISSERKKELEHDFCDMEKLAAEAEVQLRHAQRALARALKELPEKQIRWKLHKKNRTHVKNQADFVDLREYRETLKHMEEARSDLDQALSEISTLREDVQYFTEVVENAEWEKKLIQIELSTYGKVIEFVRVA